MRNKLWVVAGGVVVACFVAAIVGLSVVTGVVEDELTAFVEEDLAADIDGTLAVEDVDVSLFARFPTVDVRLRGLTVVGAGPFEGVQLAALPETHIGIALGSVLSDEGYRVERLELDAPVLSVVIDEEGRANYDIWIAAEDDEESEYSVLLDALVVTDGTLLYDDREGEMQLALRGLEHTSSGDVTQDAVSLQTTTSSSLDVDYAGWSLLSEVRLAAEVPVTYHLASGQIDLGESAIHLNELDLGLSGRLTPVDAGWDVDVAYQALESTFKDLLSIVPGAYTADFAEVVAAGAFTLTGTAQGLYHSEEDHLPAFDVGLEVTDASVAYPDLPSTVDDIAARVAITHPEGPTDDVVVDVTTFRFSTGGSPFTGSLRLAHPTTDPEVALDAEGHLDLDTVMAAWPMEGTVLAGVVDLDVDVAGRQSAFEAKDFGRITAEGSVAMQDVRYESVDLPVDTVIERFSMDLSPQRARVNDLVCSFGDSDVAGSGQVDNLVAYMLGADELVGNLSLKGDRLDLEPFAGDDGAAEVPEDDEESGPLLVAVPEDLDIEVRAHFGEVLGWGLTFTDLDGLLVVRDGSLRMEGLEAEMFGGQVVIGGTYTAPTAEVADIALDLDVVRLDLPQTVAAFDTLERIVPVLAGATGFFDSGMTLAARLGADGTPELASLSSRGKVKTYDLELTPGVLGQAAELLMDRGLGEMSLDKSRFSYVLEDGELALDPTRVLLGTIPADLHGTAGVLARTMDLNLDLTLPVSGLQGASFVQGVTGKTVDLRVILSGPWASPKVSAGPREPLGAQVVERASDAVEARVDEARSAVVERAREEGARLVTAAEEQRAALVQAARKEGRRLRTEAREAGEALVAEAKNPIAKAAAREAAEVMEVQAARAARRLVGEAEAQGDGLVAAAEREAERLVTAAQR